MHDASFPPPPWHLVGTCWWGLFRADRPVALPQGLRPALGRRSLLLGLVRYRAGTLHYDELVVAAACWQGLRPGLWVHAIWVDSPASLAGGRQIWGLPKQLASFHWSSGRVSVTDAAGPIVTLDLDHPARSLPPIWLAGSGFGRPAGWIQPFPVCGWACLAPGRIALRDWSARFSYRLASRPLLALAAAPFRARFGDVCQTRNML